MDKPEQKFSLVIPTYNEAANIEGLLSLLDSVLSANNINFEIIVVDDDSPDQTWKIAQEIAKSNSRISVIHRKTEKGLATAVISGWKSVKGDILGVIDGDLQHPPEVIPALINKLNEDTLIDIVVASRNTKGGKVSKWSLWRRFISWLATFTSAFFLPEVLAKVSDPMSGFFILRKEVIEKKVLTPLGYKILVEVLAKGAYKKVAEVPYTFRERKKGGSKAGLKQYLISFIYFLKLSIQTKEIFRIIRYSAVGFVGAFITILAYLQIIKFGVSNLTAYASALEIAIINNFLLNDLWTFKDKTRRQFKNKITQFFKFNLICLNGAIISFLIFAVLAKFIKSNSVYALIFGVSAGFFWNFIVSTNCVWLSEFTLKKNKTIPEKGYYHTALEKNKIQRYWHYKKFELVSQRVGLGPILDIGSGSGVFSNLYPTNDRVVINLDNSFEQLAYGKNLNPGVFYVNADACNLPFLPNSIGTVTLIETIEHLAQDQFKKLLSEIYRVLKNNGRIVITTPNYKSLWPLLENIISIIGPIDYKIQHKTHFDLNKLSHVLNDAGFSVNKKGSFFVFSPFLSIISKKIADFGFAIEQFVAARACNIIIVDALKNKG